MRIHVTHNRIHVTHMRILRNEYYACEKGACIIVLHLSISFEKNSTPCPQNIPFGIDSWDVDSSFVSENIITFFFRLSVESIFR